MTAFLRLTGVAALLDAMEDAIEQANGPQEYWVGSAVEYGPFHEFGTSKMSARPHWVPGIQAVAAEFGVVVDGNEAVNVMISGERGLVRLIAFKLERHVKLLIRAKNIIDTSNYFGSIAAAPTADEALAKSESQLIK